MIPLVDIGDSKSKRDVLIDRKCFRCGNPDTYVSKKTGVAAWRKRKIIVNGKKVWDGENYYCDLCEHKLRRKCRNKDWKKDSNQGKGFRVEQAIAKALDLKNCNLELDNFNAVFDLYDPVKYKDIQSRSAGLVLMIKRWPKADGTEGVKRYLGWQIGNLDPFKEYDNLFAVCMTKNYKDIDRIYVIPVDRLPASEGIIIYKCNIETEQQIMSQYEDCRDDKLLEIVRKAYHSLNIQDCPVIKNDKIDDKKKDLLKE